MLVAVAVVVPTVGSAARVDGGTTAAMDVPAIVARVLPAVVSITTRHVGGETREGAVVHRGLGSGVIVDPRGYILTNHHVIERAEKIKVGLPDGRTFPGMLVGADRVTDLAVVKIDGTRLPTAVLAGSATPRIGEPVIAIGNPLWIEGGPTVTAGVVSGLERILEQPGLPMLHHLIQTDAAINDGNSGGPLVNRGAQVIGINTALIPSAHGIGFAIPASTAVPVLRELIAAGVIRRPTLGVVAISVTPQVAYSRDLPVERGVVVLEVAGDGPAAAAGLQPGDVVTALDGRPLRNLHDLHQSLWRRRPGDTVSVEVRRGGVSQTVRAILAEDAARPVGR